MRSAGGQPDLELRAIQGSLDERLYAQVAADPQVAVASPVLEIGTMALTPIGRASRCASSAWMRWWWPRWRRR